MRDSALAGSLPGVRRVGHADARMRRCPRHARAWRRVDAPVPIGEVERMRRPRRAHRGPRARPGARRRPRARLGHAARRRAGDGQEHAAAAGPGPHGRAGRTRCLLVTAEESCAQVRLRAERVGALARRPARRGRDLAAARARPRRIGAARRAWRSTRSRPSSIPTFPVRRVRSPRYATARTGSCSTPRSASCATVLVGPRHEGGHPRRAAGARARRRHRALVRRRPRPLAAHAARARSTASGAPTSSACSR